MADKRPPAFPPCDDGALRASRGDPIGGGGVLALFRGEAGAIIDPHRISRMSHIDARVIESFLGGSSEPLRRCRAPTCPLSEHL